MDTSKVTKIILAMAVVLATVLAVNERNTLAEWLEAAARQLRSKE